ncbi:tRNA (adenosine(37)-N6)-threonylcarbamoyltransferase complex dimerization subunit type 1 TsaB [Alicyclobacillus curvatus]|nr:tRNA (adenosine(37)-N6)-threonylcarbamoyltransferase complex dimerization subunit type 1 TsaB [Alicyclobacillus curvatus]
MAVLTMDTSTQALCAALGKDGQTLVSAVSLIPRAHSRLLQPMLQQLLQSAGWTPMDLTGVAVGMGPGSYTGVRLAVATAKALAATLSIPVIPIPTLAALAEAACPGEARSTTYVMPLIYARRERAFGAIYAKTGVQWVCVEDTQVMQVSSWLDTLQTRLAAAANTTAVVLHDFTGRSDLAPLTALSGARSWVDTVLELNNVAADIGPAMVRIAERQDFGCTPRNGEDIHALVPDYALRVEAEVKQSEGSSADGTGGNVQS